MLIEAVNDNREIGSCTCVLATLDEQAPLMYTANLGDSGYMILRKEGLDLVKLFRSKEQQHSFNFPFQVGTGGDDPAKADAEVHDVRDRDIVVLGSDGLWDNLFDIKVIELIRPFIRDTDLLADPELVAEVIASEAEKYSL
jgi:protein phosphatase PTC7